MVKYVYTLGAGGERVKVEELDRTVEYTYDELYRLTSETITEGKKVTTYTYAYDSVSNRTLKTVNGDETVYTYNSLNQLISENDTTYEYDNAGNLVRVIGSGKSALYEYKSDPIVKAAKELKNEYLNEYNSMFDEFKIAVVDTSSFAAVSLELSAIAKKYGNKGLSAAFLINLADTYILHSTELAKSMLGVLAAEYTFYGFEDVYDNLIKGTNYYTNNKYHVFESNIYELKTAYCDLLRVHIMGEKAYSEYMLIWQKIKLYLDDNDNEILTSVNYNIQYCQELLDKYNCF